MKLPTEGNEGVSVIGTLVQGTTSVAGYQKAVSGTVSNNGTKAASRGVNGYGADS